jgi:putative ABC transport system ATP-binding protein
VNTVAFSVRDLRFTYPGARSPALDGINLTILHGDRVAVLGYSGNGKSTLLHILGAIDRPDFPADGSAGVAIYQGRDGRLYDLLRLTAGQRRALLGAEFGFIFQNTHLLPYLTAMENVAARMIESGRPIDESYDRARAAMESLGIGDLLDRKPSEVSGGQRQRIAIARAIVHRPPVVFADEPTASLDPKTARENLALLANSLDGHGATLVLVTHNFAEALEIGRRFVILSGGRVFKNLSVPPGVAAPTRDELVTLLDDGQSRVPPSMSVASRPVAPSARWAWTALCIKNDLRDARTVGFSSVAFLVSLLSTLVLCLVVGVRNGTIDALQRAVTANPGFRRIEVRPKLEINQEIQPDQVDAIRSLPDVSDTEAFAMVSYRFLDRPNDSVFLVLGDRDPSWQLVDPGELTRRRFGVVVSQDLALDAKWIDRPIDVPLRAWADLPESRRKLSIFAPDRRTSVPLPVLGISRDLRTRLGRDFVIDRRTQWTLDNWTPAFAFGLKDPAGQPLSKPDRAVISQEVIAIIHPARDWEQVLAGIDQTPFENLIRGWEPRIVARTRGPAEEGRLTLLWQARDPSGQWVPGPIPEVDHNRGLELLRRTLVGSGFEVRPGAIVYENTPEGPGREPEMPNLAAGLRSANLSVFLRDFWRLPQVLAKIRRLGLIANSPVEDSVLILKAADTLLGIALGLSVLVVTALAGVAVGSSAFTLLDRSRGEIGIHLSSGIHRGRILAHYLGLVGSIVVVGTALGIVLAELGGYFLRIGLDRVDRDYHLSLGFDLGGGVVALIATFEVLTSALAVAWPWALATRHVPARLLSQRVS